MEVPSHGKAHPYNRVAFNLTDYDFSQLEEQAKLWKVKPNALARAG